MNAPTLTPPPGSRSSATSAPPTACWRTQPPADLHQRHSPND